MATTKQKEIGNPNRKPGASLRMQVIAAYCLGVLLPVAEVCRRRTDFSNIPGYIDDFIIGAILLFAARSVSKGRRTGPVLLAVAWGLFCGGMYYSFFDQFTQHSATDVSGLKNGIVVAVKGALYLIGIVALIRSIRTSVSLSNS